MTAKFRVKVVADTERIFTFHGKSTVQSINYEKVASYKFFVFWYFITVSSVFDEFALGLRLLMAPSATKRMASCAAPDHQAKRQHKNQEHHRYGFGGKDDGGGRQRFGSI
jgi:hypothetical protein